MQFDPENNIVKLCAKGMEQEGLNNTAEAENLFKQAWHEATNDLEKFIAAHYLARAQRTVAEKLQWDNSALSHALKVQVVDITGAFPSLYLNIARCHEELEDYAKAKLFYDEANNFAAVLPNDGYGNLLRNGIIKGLERIKNKME